MRRLHALFAWCGVALLLLGFSGLGLSAWAQHGGHSMPMKPAAPAETKKPIRTTMDELHKSGGVPPGWTFAFPSGGDPAKGRAVFVSLECYSCHTVKGEKFPPGKTGDVGPELTAMGNRHPAEYFAESILNPNAVILEGPGFTGPDGLTKMPDYRDSLTVAELIDLVAYLRSLTGEGEMHMEHGQPAPKGH